MKGLDLKKKVLYVFKIRVLFMFKFSATFKYIFLCSIIFPSIKIKILLKECSAFNRYVWRKKTYVDNVKHFLNFHSTTDSSFAPLLFDSFIQRS